MSGQAASQEPGTPPQAQERAHRLVFSGDTTYSRWLSPGAARKFRRVVAPQLYAEATPYLGRALERRWAAGLRMESYTWERPVGPGPLER